LFRYNKLKPIEIKMKEKIDQIVGSRETKVGLYFDCVIQFLTLLSLLAFTIETILNLEEKTISILNNLEPASLSSIFSSLWWSIVILTTVGYGDVIPIIIGGRSFTFLILMIGLGIIVIPSGMISSALAEARNIEKKNKN
jgi:voltage-gated potassium channel Kch